MEHPIVRARKNRLNVETLVDVPVLRYMERKYTSARLTCSDAGTMHKDNRTHVGTPGYSGGYSEAGVQP
jgi:hypothetical protein